jgi:hypothetical protein
MMAGNGLALAVNVDHTLLEFSMMETLHPISLQQFDPGFAAQSRFERQKFKIRLASNQERRQSAVFLVEKMYSWRGYNTSAIAATPAEGVTRISLMVYGQDNCPIGTLTVGFDGPNGMLADELYGEELDQMRQQGKRLLEFTKLAIDRHAANSNRIVAALTNIAYLYGKMSKCDTAVIEVHPRHVAFYQSKLGFRQVGSERVCPRVNAPAILLALDWSVMADEIKKYGGRKDDGSAGKSLYRYFFGEQDEAGLIKRLVAGDVG